MSLNKPNIFNYATTELTQDAVIAWLAAWADNQNKAINEPLHLTGKAFLQSLVAKKEIRASKMEVSSIRVQHRKIDVLIELTLDSQKAVILIEDKVNSSEHSNQLARNLSKINKNAYDVVIPIYFKTGFQHNVKEVSANSGYFHYGIKDWIKVFEEGIKLGVKNDIFSSYHRYLKNLESTFDEAKEAYTKYQEILVKDWKWWHWIGFFEANKTKFKAQWGSIGNNREPLLTFWYGNQPVTCEIKDKEHTFTIYMDVKYSSFSGVSASYRLGLNGEPQQNKRIRDEIIHQVRPRIAEHGILLQTPRFRKAKDTLELLKVNNLANNDWNHTELAAFLHKMRDALAG